MNAPMTAEQLTEDVSIANRAMKAVFHRGVGAARRTRDRDAEAAVKKEFGDEGQIVTKKLFTNKQGIIYRRQQLANEMYVYHTRATLPHSDDGARILPNTAYFDYTQRMADYESRINAMDQQILSTYYDLVDQDIAERVAALIRQGKGGVYLRDEYPTIDEMGRYLYVEWVLEPISTVNDYRYEVDPAIRARLEKRLEQIAVDAKAELFARMLEPMKKFVDKLAVPDAVFRNSLVDNLNELAQDLPKLNFDGDPRIQEGVDELKRLITPFTFNPDALREQPEVRMAAKDKMEELMKKMEAYGYR